MDFLATDRLRITIVDGQFDSKDSLAHTSFVKDGTVFLHHHFDFSSCSEIDVGANASVLLEFRGVASVVPGVDAGASGVTGSWWASNQLTMLS